MQDKATSPTPPDSEENSQNETKISPPTSEDQTNNVIDINSLDTSVKEVRLDLFITYSN